MAEMLFSFGQFVSLSKQICNPWNCLETNIRGPDEDRDGADYDNPDQSNMKRSVDHFVVYV